MIDIAFKYLLSECGLSRKLSLCHAFACCGNFLDARKFSSLQQLFSLVTNSH